MSNAFVIGNGESRKIFPIEKLKGAGTIYGCNAIYRDNPDLCDAIISVNPEMTEELLQAASENKINSNTKIYGKDNLPDFSYVLDTDPKNDRFRFWHGHNLKTDSARKLDLSVARGSGCSAIQIACNDDHENIFIIGFEKRPYNKPVTRANPSKPIKLSNDEIILAQLDSGLIAP